MGAPQNEGFVGRGEAKRWARVGLKYSIQPKAKLELRRKLLAEIFLFLSYSGKLRRLKGRHYETIFFDFFLYTLAYAL